MTKEEAIKELSEIDRDDQERAHGEADSVLLNFLHDNGYREITDAYSKLDDECGGFWYA